MSVGMNIIPFGREVSEQQSYSFSECKRMHTYQLNYHYNSLWVTLHRGHFFASHEAIFKKLKSFCECCMWPDTPPAISHTQRHWHSEAGAARCSIMMDSHGEQEGQKDVAWEEMLQGKKKVLWSHRGKCLVSQWNQPRGKMYRRRCVTGLSICLLGNCEITY